MGYDLETRPDCPLAEAVQVNNHVVGGPRLNYHRRVEQLVEDKQQERRIC